MGFSSLGLSKPILDAVLAQGYDAPTPIQREAIPAVLAGKDVMAAAQTGTGKTAGFTLPILEQLLNGQRAGANQVRALILTPTRELAAQVAASVETYGKNLNLRSTVVFGGVKINPQMMKLRQGADVLVATPGRLMDLYQQNAVKFNNLEILVLDEADRMLDMGFIHDIRKIIALLPAKRQNLLFSATFSQEIRGLAKGLVNNPVEISVTPRNAAAKSVKQWLVPVDKKRKPQLLVKMINDLEWGQVLVFSRTKHGANKLTKFLEDAGIQACAIHGNKSQGARTKALANFKNGTVQVLVATDIAARGLDIDQLPHVVNFDLPNVPEDYVHRIGRTGRAGATGEAVSLVSADEEKQLVDIERLTQSLLPREYVDGFDPVHSLPETQLRPPARPKRPKKPKPSNGQRDGSRREGSPAGGRSDKPSSARRNARPGSGSGGSANSRGSAGSKDSNRRGSGGSGRNASSGRSTSSDNNGNSQSRTRDVDGNR